MAYDPSSGRLIMFGGRSSETDLLSDTWAYDPATNAWTELMPSGNLPPARAQPAMAYDPAAHRLIMFGGWDLDADFGDTWAYDPSANTWADLDPSGTVASRALWPRPSLRLFRRSVDHVRWRSRRKLTTTTPGSTMPPSTPGQGSTSFRALRRSPHGPVDGLQPFQRPPDHVRRGAVRAMTTSTTLGLRSSVDYD